MATIRELLFKLTATTGGFQSGMKKGQKELTAFEKSTKAFNSSLTRLGGTLAGFFAADRLVRFGFDAVKAFGEAELAVVRLDSSLKSMGRSLSAKDITGFSESLMTLTTLDDDQINAAAASLSKFGNVADSLFKRTLRAGADIAAQTGEDLEGVVDKLGRALNDPKSGARVLRQFGVTPDELKSINSANSLWEKQLRLLEAIEKRSKGAAAAQANTPAGRSAQLGVAFGEAKEALGGAIAPIIKPFLEREMTSLKLLGEKHNAVAQEIIKTAQEARRNLQRLSEADLQRMGGELAGERKRLGDAAPRFEFDPILKPKLNAQRAELDQAQKQLDALQRPGVQIGAQLAAAGSSLAKIRGDIAELERPKMAGPGVILRDASEEVAALRQKEAALQKEVALLRERQKVLAATAGIMEKLGTVNALPTAMATGFIQARQQLAKLLIQGPQQAREFLGSDLVEIVAKGNLLKADRFFRDNEPARNKVARLGNFGKALGGIFGGKPNALQEQAQDLRERLLDPQEQFSRELGGLKLLRAAGKIDDKTFVKGLAKARADIFGEGGDLAPAILKGSGEAALAAFRHQNDPQKRAEKLAEQELEELKRQGGLLADILRKIGIEPPANVAKF